jgi:hypothetical protein
MISYLASWSAAHPEWVTVCGIVVAVIQALINSSRRPFWLSRLPPSLDTFGICFVSGVIVIALGGLIGLCGGVNLGDRNAGLVAGLAVGTLVNVALAAFTICTCLLGRSHYTIR